MYVDDAEEPSDSDWREELIDGWLAARERYRAAVRRGAAATETATTYQESMRFYEQMLDSSEDELSRATRGRRPPSIRSERPPATRGSKQERERQEKKARQQELMRRYLAERLERELRKGQGQFSLSVGKRMWWWFVDWLRSGWNS